MPKYVVYINATNYLVEMDGLLAKRSFITSRQVTADDATAAEFAAVQMIRDDPQLGAIMRNDDKDPARMTVYEICEVESFNAENQPGKIWYDVEQKRWWRFWKR